MGGHNHSAKRAILIGMPDGTIRLSKLSDEGFIEYQDVLTLTRLIDEIRRKKATKKC